MPVMAHFLKKDCSSVGNDNATKNDEEIKMVDTKRLKSCCQFN